MLVFFQKVSKVINKAFASLGTTIKITNETIARPDSDPITNVSFGTMTLKLRCVCQTKNDMEGNPKQDIYSNQN